MKRQPPRQFAGGDFARAVRAKNSQIFRNVGLEMLEKDSVGINLRF
jgi:hypothetical protein